MILFLNNFNCFLNYGNSVFEIYINWFDIMIELVLFTIPLSIDIVLLSMDLDFYLIYYLVCSLCESGVGISTSVLIVRYYGNDIYYFMNYSQFYDNSNFIIHVFNSINLNLFYS